MAIIAKKYANKVYITNDNPRYENPKIIRESIKKYCQKGIEISNRRKAIYEAILKLDVNDVLIIAGKGHEKTQDINGVKYPFDDKEVLKQCLNKLNK